MLAFFLILSITLSYFSFQILTILKNKLEQHNHLLPTFAQQGFNYESKPLFILILAHYIVPSTAFYLLFGGGAYWKLILFLIIHLAFFGIVGVWIVNAVLKSFKIDQIRPEGKLILFSWIFTLLAIFSLAFAYLYFR